MSAAGSRRAVFLDRDGTLIEESGYLDRIERLAFFPYSVDAVRLLNRGGFAVVIVSNQSGIARGIVPPTFPEEAHAHIVERLALGGASIERFYYCPHHPEGTVEGLNRRCACRKPKPGLLQQAAADLDLDLSRSFAVGDRWQDVGAGQAAGARGILVRTGYGRTEEQCAHPGVEAAAVRNNLIEAVSWILGQA